MSQAPQLAGKLPADAVRTDVRRIPAEVCDRFRAIEDLTGAVSDVLDELAVRGAIGTSMLHPTIAGARIVGTALTLRDEPRPELPNLYASTHDSRRGEIEAHNLAQPGDVLVVQGMRGVSSMGGLSASLGHRQGEIGAVIDGGCRDIEVQAQLGYAIWARDVTPVTGKWRIETVEVNGPVTICGVRVDAGDLVVADSTGVCFVPADLVNHVLTRVEEITAGEAERYRDIESGLPAADLATKTYSYMRH